MSALISPPAASYASPLTAPLAASNWTAYNVSSATLTDVATGIAIYAPSVGASNVLQGYERTLAAGFDFKAKIASNFLVADTPRVGIYFRDASVTPNIVSLTVSYYPGTNPVAIEILSYAGPTGSPTGLGFVVLGANPSTERYLRIRDTGTAYSFELSTEGAQWVSFATKTYVEAGISVPTKGGVCVSSYQQPSYGVLLGCSGI